jgi:hypothetical protein
MYVLCVVVSPFVLSRLAIVLSVLQFTDFDYPFGIFKLFLQHWVHKTQDEFSEHDEFLE